MNINIERIPFLLNKWDMTREIAKVLHSEDFGRNRTAGGRLVNFEVVLNRDEGGGIRNNGTGLLTLPDATIGFRFLDYVRENPVKVATKETERKKKQTLVFYKRKNQPSESKAATLQKTPYVDPDNEEKRAKVLYDLEDQLYLDAVQFGTFFRSQYPTREGERTTPRSFSVEWEKKFVGDGVARMEFDYDNKLIKLKLGSELQDSVGYSISINFSSLQKIGAGYDSFGIPYICFDTHTPPVLDKFSIHRTTTGDERIDRQKYKERVGAIDPAHAAISPYAHQVRVVLFNDSSVDVVKKFIKLCETAGITRTLILACSGPVQIEAVKKGFFSEKRLFHLHRKLAQQEWPVAFQLAALLHNALLNTEDIEELLQNTLQPLLKKKSAPYVGELLRRYGETMKNRPDLVAAKESPLDCFRRVSKAFAFDSGRSLGYQAYHITFSPTRLILDGPFPSQSNRIIRRYADFADHFIRVDFKDEDRLAYRWDRSVDGAPFLHHRVGGTLKNGFELAGRRFEFLAYSSSALRQHSVWFMHQFDHPQHGHVDSETIRRSIVDYTKEKGQKLLKTPSKFAARLAQAFTATDHSVFIRSAEWEEVPDLGAEPWWFTDGVGTISRKLAVRIWTNLCEGKRDHVDLAFIPSAYQIRFLGYKGVVCIDDELDKNPGGIQMRLRPSMNKFETPETEVAPIEIAQAFEFPNNCYLNRPLVTLLEGLGVRPEAFKDLQDIAVANARTIDESLEQFVTVMKTNGLGHIYRLRQIMMRLNTQYNLDLKPTPKRPGMDSPFLRQVRQVAMNAILRDIKHSARISVPNSYLLVGVADEGPAYQASGHQNVFCLGETDIYICIQEGPDAQPVWLEGMCSISRSPVVHPGDVQPVYAIGKPPDNVMCLFKNLKNVVVLPSVGTRSLASCLGGGDVDGDLFSVIFHSELLPNQSEAAGSYESAGTWELDRDTRIEDICDFVVKYIQSDLLGLLSDRWLVIADQSIDSVRDENCIQLARLCSQAVDFPKQGVPINIDDDELPKTLIRCKPDWHAAEVVSPRATDYYESDRVLGQLYRDIIIEDPVEDSTAELQGPTLSDPISAALLDDIMKYCGPAATVGLESFPQQIISAFQKYSDELKYICVTHTLSNAPGIKLLEAEVVVGTILAKCSQKRFRKDRIYRMVLHASTLVRDTEKYLIDDLETQDPQLLMGGLEYAWKAWHMSLRKRKEFGANSFGLIALGTIFDCLDRLKKIIDS